MEAQLQQLADHDALTGLVNRRRFTEELERALVQSRRRNETGAVLLLDLDGARCASPRSCSGSCAATGWGGMFLRNAERLGLVEQIDRWVIERAVRQITETAAITSIQRARGLAPSCASSAACSPSTTPARAARRSPTSSTRASTT